ncbi:hypothetical protein [Photorhabdus sp. RM96S]|uniref:hypothetical protein n=1 Tax=Photorhabdus sp. RM96S TaxID=3342822 RepID=UPI0036DB6E94
MLIGYARVSTLSQSLDLQIKALNYGLFTIFLYWRQREIIDELIELFIQIVHWLSVRAERKLVKTLLSDFQKVHGKTALLFWIF